MTKVNPYNISQAYKNEYSTWREMKDLNSAKRQEYLRRNPDAIKDYDLQRAKILLSAVDMMDKSVIEKSDNFGTFFESIANIGLASGAIFGTTVGLILKNKKFINKIFDKIAKNNSKIKNIVSLSFTALSGIMGILAVYPLYSFSSQIEAKINRKRRFDTMEKELQDPKIFVVLDSEQKRVFRENLEEIENNKKKLSTNIIKKNYKNIKQLTKEVLYYDKRQTEFEEKYKEDKNFYDETLTEKEIKNAKKDKVLLSVLIKELNTKSQSYSEKMDKIVNNLIAITLGLNSLFVLGYESIAKKMKLKQSSFPAGAGMISFACATILGTWATKRASQVGRFKAQQDLMQKPEELIYISKRKTDSINDDEIFSENIKNKKNTGFKFLKEFFQNNKEYKEWQKNLRLNGKDITQAMENIELSSEQLQDGERLKKNMFKSFYKVDKNTQKYSSKIQLLNESVKYPITLALGGLSSVFGLRYLAKIRTASSPKDGLKNIIKYIGTTTLFTIPIFLINSYFAKTQKMAARIADMMSMKDLEDYRFFADYSRFKTE